MNWHDATKSKPADGKRVLVYCPEYERKWPDGGIHTNAVQFGKYDATRQRWAIAESFSEHGWRVTHWAKACEPRDHGGILNCPFCGRKPQVIYANEKKTVTRVMCEAKSGCTNPDTGWKHNPKKRWNRRAD